MHAIACLQGHGAASVAARQPFPFSEWAAERPHTRRDDVVLIADGRRVAAGEQAQWWLPGSPRICIVQGDGSASVRIRNRDFSPLATVSLIGPTSHAHRLSIEGATVISFALTPIGWSRLFRESAASIRNLVVPLEQLAGPRLATDLAGLVTADAAAACRAVTRALFPPLPVRTHPDESLIRAIADMVDDPATTQVREMTDRLGIPSGVSLRWRCAISDCLPRCCCVARAFCGRLRRRTWRRAGAPIPTSIPPITTRPISFATPTISWARHRAASGRYRPGPDGNAGRANRR